MKSYVALIRAVNVGGRKLEMTDLKSIAEKLGVESARTYIASGNLLFTSSKDEPSLKSDLEARLTNHMGHDVDVMIRSAEEMEDVAAADPFADQPGNRVVAIFLDDSPPKDAIEHVRKAADENVALGKREIYVHYPDGQGRSKMVIPAAAKGTARNMNTVAKLAELAKEKE